MYNATVLKKCWLIIKKKTTIISMNNTMSGDIKSFGFEISYEKILK